jgi:hypothetical protein
LLSAEPAYTTPSATATDPEMTFPVVPVQIGLQVAPPVPQPAAKAYNLSSSEPTYTTPFATAGVEETAPAVAPVHRGRTAPAARRAADLERVQLVVG